KTEPRMYIRGFECARIRCFADRYGTVAEPEVSIVVPTLNEAENLPLLVPRVHAAMNRRAYELLIVDDNSRDRTQQVCAELAATYPLKLIVRPDPKNGLSGAVL